MSGHSLLSPSGAHRWLECLGSLRRCKGYDNRSSAFADEGTLAHEVASAILKGTKVPEHPEDMVEPVERYVATVLAMSQGAEMIFVEESLDLSRVMNSKGSKGTGDFIAIMDKEVQIHDLKYGKGVEVEAKGNWQLIIYGLGALQLAEMFFGDIEKVRLCIHQPRLNSFSEAVYTVEEMRDYQTIINDRVPKVLKLYESEDLPDNAYYCPGEKQCRFCPAKFECEALTRRNLELVVGEFDDFPESTELKEKVEDSIKAIPLFAPDVLGAILDNLDLLSNWISGVKARAHEMLLQGASIPGWKLVEGRAGNRAWIDEEKAEEFLKSLALSDDEMYKKKIVSPTDVNKMFKKDAELLSRVDTFVTRSAPQPTIVPESDKRPPINVKPIIDDFTVIN